MKSNKSGKSNSKKNKNESTSPIKRATFVEPSQPQMALKISVSSSAVLKRQHSNTDTDGDEKINSDDSALRLEKSCSKEQTKSPEPDLSRSSESKEELKSERNVNSSSRTFSSVIEVKPGAPPPLRIGPEVQLHLRQPFKILTDIWGVLISYDFRKTIFQFTDDHLKQYIIEHFEESETVDYVNKLAAKTAEDLAGGSWPTMPTVPTVPEDGKLNDKSLSKEAVAEAVLRNLAFRKETKDKSMLANLETIYSQVWNDGYRSKTLRPLAFADVLPNLQKWTAEPLYVKVYTFATGPPDVQKLFLSASTEGDIGKCITYFFDTHHTFKYDSGRFRQVVSGLAERDPKNLFYFTDSPKKGFEARKAGLTVFIVRRPGNKQYKQEYLDKFTVIDSFDQLDFFEFK